MLKLGNAGEKDACTVNKDRLLSQQGVKESVKKEFQFLVQIKNILPLQ